MSENVLLLGATSGIARALSHVLAKRGCALLLAGRDLSALEADATDLRLRYNVPVSVAMFDALDFQSHPQFVERTFEHFGGQLDTAVLCYGDLIPQPTVQRDFALAHRLIDVNFTSCVSLLELLAARFEQRRHGCIAAISSVAGDRGRQSNYLYGATKAALTAYLSGLRNRLYPAGVHVLTIKPGQVDTRMTQGVVRPGSPLLARPQRVAADIDRALQRRVNTLYTPWFWAIVMFCIRNLPEAIFKRLKL